MNDKITESEIEGFAIELLGKFGYQYIYAFVSKLYGSKGMNKNNLPDKQSDFLFYTGNDGKVNIEVFLKKVN